MKLPLKLTAWSKYLEIFPEEISLALGNHIQKISPFINPLNSLDDDRDGEPNGYDGVGRRGNYERLLLSELALADGFGEEFIRRAVMGEHLFLNLAKISSAAKRVSIALFDSGAMQIGSPRIVHIALLILLARRAEIAQAKFLWGTLQERKTLIFPDNMESSVQILLNSRNSGEVSAEDLISWQEELENISSKSDIWLIGSKNIFRLENTQKFSKISIDEVIEPNSREIEIQIQGASGISKKTVLELPPIEICTRILRNPFEKIRPDSVKKVDESAEITDISFDVTGGKLYAKSSDGNILAFSIDNVIRSDHKLVAKNLTRKESGDFIGFGKLKKVNAVFKRNDENSIVILHKSSGNYQVPAGGYHFEDEFVFPENGELLEIYNIRPKNFSYDEAYIKDFAGNLFHLSPSSDARKKVLRKVAIDVKAVSRGERKFIYIGREKDTENFSVVQISDKIEKIPLSQKITSAVAGRGWNNSRIFLYKDEKNVWRFYNDSNNNNNGKIIDTKNNVVGVSWNNLRGLEIFELSENRKTLEANCFDYKFDNLARKTLIKSGEEIVKISFNPQSPILAYLTVSGNIFAYSYSHNQIIGSHQK